MNRQRLDELLQAFPGRTIALLGDLFLDRYLELADVEELSIETGLEAYQIQRVRNAPGALGTVMNNLAAIGVGRLLPVTVIGDDGHGYDLLRSLEPLPLDRGHVLRVASRLTPTYTKPLRPVDGGWVELNRLDIRTRAPLEPAIADDLIAHLRQAWGQADGLIVLDQIAEPECGVVCSPIRDELRRLAGQQPDKLMIVDSRSRLGQFPFATLKGNRTELLAAAGLAPAPSVPSEPSQPPPLDLPEAIQQLRQRTGRAVFCTDGSQGIRLVDDSGLQLVPGVAVEGPIDIVGAGDSVTSALTASLLSGASSREAATVANWAASISIQKLGQTGVATPRELQAVCDAQA